MIADDKPAGHDSQTNQRGTDQRALGAILRTYKVFGRHYRSHWRVLVVAYLSLLATIAIGLATPWPLKIILDHVIQGESLDQLHQRMAVLQPFVERNPKLTLMILTASLVLIAFLKAFVSFVNKVWVAKTGYRMAAEIRERAFAHLQRLSLSFHESARTGNLIYSFTSDVSSVKHILVDLPQDVLHRLATILICGVLMLVLDWRLTLLALSTMPFLYFVTRHFGAGLKRVAREVRQREGEVASMIAENVNATALIQAYGREESEKSRFNTRNEQSLRLRIQASRMQMIYHRFSDVLVILSTAAVLFFGGRHALEGRILPGTVVVFVAYLREIAGSIEKFSDLILGLAKSQVSAERLTQLVENDMVTEDRPGALDDSTLSGPIEFKHVSFGYKCETAVISDLCLTIEAGETVAIVGHSGAGKSTLVSLLLRFYDPQQGQILVDGRDIRDVTLKSLRRQMTVLLQDAQLFQQSVAENIAFGKTDASRDEVTRAAKLADAHGFITSMPQGYETVIAEGGNSLSGGQKQRINIARAILRDTQIVILDEPATGLDARAKAKVTAAIHKLTEKKTTFIVAHSFQTIANADRVIVLEQGKPAQVGTHQQLMEACEQYRELYSLQYEQQASRALSAPGDQASQSCSPAV